MKKVVVLVLCLITLLTTACTSNRTNQDDDIERIYLTEKYYNKGEFKELISKDLSKLKKGTYILFTYNNYCTLSIPCDKIFEEFMKKYKIDFLSIPFEEFKNTKFYETVKYAPSAIIVNSGEIVAYLDANSDEDLAKYQDSKEFEKWLNNYIYFTKK